MTDSALETLKGELMNDEGIRLSPYKDTVGKLTIGCGHNLTDKPISANAALAILDDDIADTLKDIREHLPWFEQLSEARQRVLANMAFNMGVRGLVCFTRMLAAAQSGDYETAASEMLQSKWAKQVGHRAERLADMMRGRA